MPDTGAPWNIPYVTSADLVSDWPADSLALANAIDAGLDAAGGLVAVEYVVKTNTETISQASQAVNAVTGLSISHAAADASNKIVLFGVLTGHQGTTEGGRGGIMLYAGGSVIESPTSPSNRQPVMSFMGGPVDLGTMKTVNVMAVYSPASTSSITYDLRVSNGTAATRTFYINRTANDTDNGEHPRGVSTLLLMEVKS